MEVDFRKDTRLRFFIGDVRDYRRLCWAMDDCEVVIHAAALKRIETCHYNPDEAKATNIDGAQNVIFAARQTKVAKVVALSTDKAVEPISTYGDTKKVAESLFRDAEYTRGRSGPHFARVRYGNIWRSAGSVVPKWEQMLAGEALTAVPISDPDCTRFFMRMDEAVDLVLQTIETMKGGELNIPTLPAYRLGDLAEAMQANTFVTGLPEWEKKHEMMDVHQSSDRARRMTIKELRAAL